MISLEAYLTFIAASVALGLLPGPAIALFIATCTTKGLRQGLFAYAGNTTGLSVLIVAAIIGMAPLLSLASYWFDIIRLVGAFYLVWMGIGLVRKGLAHQGGEQQVVVKSKHYFLQGFLVSMSNPKVLLFLGAFFPQFLDPSQSMIPQLILLGVTFLVIIAVIDFLIVLTSGYARRWLLEKQKATHVASGALLVGAGVGLALARK
ncbi:MAG: LysE family translocator [bacterium]|nr:LysE family translocator [bacterium]